MNTMKYFAFRRRGVAFVLTFLWVLILTVPSGQATELDGFSQWLRDTYPAWREEDADIVVAGVAAALEENASSLAPEQRQLLIEAGMANIQRVFSPERKTLPADFPLFAETYRMGVEGYVNRKPLSEEEQAKLNTQLDEIYKRGAGLLAESRAGSSEAAAAMLEVGKADLESSMRDPLSSSLKQPFTEEEMQAIRDGMNAAAEDFATGEAPQFPRGEVPPGLEESLAETFAGRLLDSLVEVDDARALPIYDEMGDLLQQEADQANQNSEDRMKKAIMEHHEHLQREAEADARELSRLRAEQDAMAPPAPVEAQAAPQKAADIPPSPPAPVEESPPPQSSPADAPRSSWAFPVSMLGVGVVALAGLWAYRRRVG